MRELADILWYWLKGRYCAVVGHRWMTLPADYITWHRICLRCLLHQSGVSDGKTQI